MTLQHVKFKQKFDKWIMIYIILLPLPVFFNINGTIYQGAAFGADVFALPISLFVGILLIVLRSKIFVKGILRSSTLILPFIFVQIIVFLIFSIIYNGKGDPSLLIISTLPLLVSYSIGSYARRSLSFFDFETMIKFSIRGLAIISALHLLYSFSTLGFVVSFAKRGTDDIFGLFSIYQKLVYYPTILSIFFVLSLYFDGKISRICSVLILLNILMIGSRESFLMVLFGLVSIFYRIYLTKNFKYIPVLIIIFFLLGMFLFSSFENILSTFGDATLVTKLRALEEGGDYSAGRSEMISRVFDSRLNNFTLLLGTGYNNENILSPHNQYLEVLVRGGVFSLVLFMLLVGKSIVDYRLNWRKKINVGNYKIVYALFVSFLLLLVVSFNVNTPVRAPYSSALFGFLLGYFSFGKLKIIDVSNSLKTTI
ncbi:hypothetical protein MED134_05979 [Dokdonia sp. MED134]|uniref:O-antigen ligase family protein n=1 Tax=Dokdonia sp. MED134 TaxID=313590 RepID=UPI000068AA93|nr:O-antigen ligase family protein [Dokdonia sp. MED134]EAQ40279.1 hypothetical protein MED134_05979 [Dokdonia sp. MED134]